MNLEAIWSNMKQYDQQPIIALSIKHHQTVIKPLVFQPNFSPSQSEKDPTVEVAPDDPNRDDPGRVHIAVINPT